MLLDPTRLDYCTRAPSRVPRPDGGALRGCMIAFALSSVFWIFVAAASWAVLA